jgi:hypothetical protein
MSGILNRLNIELTLIVRRSCRELKKMKSKKELGILLLSALVLYPMLVIFGNVLSKDENLELSEVVFFVS